jgi:Gpi18-like mannosyltransferase
MPSERFFLGLPNPWLNPWTLYDSEWYLRIAARGYESVTTAFFPLYAWLLSLAGPDNIRMALWGMAISNSCFFATLYFFYRLTVIDFDEKVAGRAVFLLAFFPTTAFFSAVYTESLFLLLTVLSFYLVRKRQWVQAGFLAGLAGLTRNSGWILFVMLAIEYVRYLKTASRRSRWREALSILLPLLAFLGILGYFALKFRSLSAGFESQEYFYRSWSWPWAMIQLDLSTLWRILEELLGDVGEPLNWGGFVFFLSLNSLYFINTVLPVFALALVLRYRKCLPLSYAVYIFLILAMHLFYARVVFPYTAGTMRYLMVTFPFVQLVAKSLDRFDSNSIFRNSTISIFAVLLVISSIAFGYKFFLG